MRIVNVGRLASTCLAVAAGLLTATPDALASPGVSAHPEPLTLAPCEVEVDGRAVAADCGTLTVPENRARADSRSIDLPVVRIRTTGPSPAEPIFWLEGGPGQSNLKIGGARLSAPLLARHDFVLVGYRGVDGSSVLECPEVRDALFGDGDDLLSEASRVRFGEAARRCAGRLQAEGTDLAGYTMLEVIADIEEVRTALGFERIDLLSESYGTRLAQIYAWRHPNRIHRSVMVAVNPPGHFVWQPQVIDEQLRYYSELCAADAGCRERTPDLAASVAGVVRNMPKRWLFLPIDPGKIRSAAFFLLTNRNSAATAFDAFLAAERGDPSGLAMMSLVWDFLMPSAIVWGEFLAKGSADFDPARSYAAELDPPHAILGSPVSLIYFDGLVRHWPTTAIPPEFRRVQPSATETLLISGSVDFATPARFAEDELLPSLANGKHVILRDIGHTDDLWGLQPGAMAAVLTDFYDAGTVDESRFAFVPMDFRVRFGLPEIAKALLVSAAFLVVLAAAGVWFVARRFVRRAGPHAVRLR